MGWAGVGKREGERRCRLAAARNCVYEAAVEKSCCWAAGRCRSVGVEGGGGEGEVAGAAVMELRLPSSGGLNVMQARQPRYWGHTLPLAGNRMRSNRRASRLIRYYGPSLEALQEPVAHGAAGSQLDDASTAAREAAIRFPVRESKGGLAQRTSITGVTQAPFAHHSGESAPVDRPLRVWHVDRQTVI